MNSTIKAKVRNILNELWEAGVSKGEYYSLPEDMDVETTNKKILDFIEQTCLEVIGEDGEVKGHLRPNGLPSIDLTESYNNALRAKQRARLKSLMEDKDQLTI